MKSKSYIILFFAFLIYSFSLLFSKLASSADSRLYFVLYYSASFAFLAAYAVLWQIALKNISLTTAYSLKSLTIIINMLMAMIVLSETISFTMLIGSLFIISGSFLISRYS